MQSQPQPQLEPRLEPHLVQDPETLAPETGGGQGEKDLQTGLVEQTADGTTRAPQDTAESLAPLADAVEDRPELDDFAQQNLVPSRPLRGTPATLSPGTPRLRRTLSGGSSGTGAYARDTTDVVAKGEFNGKISVGDDYQCVIPTNHTADTTEEVTRVGTIRWCPEQAGASMDSSCTRNGSDALDKGDGNGRSSTSSAEHHQFSQTGSDLASFLETAKKAHPTVLVDELMSILHDHQYDIVRALDTLKALTRARAHSQQEGEEDPAAAVVAVPQHILDVESLDNYSEDDKAEFYDALLKYGKDFSKIQRRVLPSRTVPQLILYYYLRFKGTPQFFEWQEQSFNKTNDDECAAPHCPWGSADSDGGGGGGGGGLLCCDGCPQAFHFSCCQPKPVSVLSLVGRKWYCAKCTRSRLRWGRELNPCSDNPARYDSSPCSGHGEIRLSNDTKMLPPAPVMQYKSLSCNPRCKHCIQLLAGASGGVGIVGDGGSNYGRRRSGRQAAVAEVNVFRGAGLNVREPVIGIDTTATSDGSDSESDNLRGGGVHSDSFSDEPRSRTRGRSNETQSDDGRLSDSADENDEDESGSAGRGRRKKQRLQRGENRQ